MHNPETVALRDALAEAPVRFLSERRGFNTRKGVPDALVWVGPDVAGGQLCVPILFELESVGGYHAVKRDVSEFASRGGDDDHRYHLVWPTRVPVDREPVTVDVTYDVRAVPTATVTGEYAASEKLFYDSVKSWADRRFNRADTSAWISVYDEMEVVWWSVHTRAFGFDLAVRVPVISAAPPGMTSVEMTQLIEQRAAPTLTMFAVIDGRPGVREDVATHPTRVNLTQLPSARHVARWSYA